MIGRKVLVKVAATQIPGLTSSEIKIGDSEVDITSGENNGFMLFEQEGGEKSLELSLDITLKQGDVFINRLLDPTLDKYLEDVVIEFGILNPSNTTPMSITADFKFSGSISNPQEDKVTISVDLLASGGWVYSAEAA